MVKLYAKKRDSAIPNELVGLEDPNPYMFALLRHTAVMDKEKERIERTQHHKTVAPANTLAREIKAFSLFPNIYGGAHAIGQTF